MKESLSLSLFLSVSLSLSPYQRVWLSPANSFPRYPHRVSSPLRDNKAYTSSASSEGTRIPKKERSGERTRRRDRDKKRDLYPFWVRRRENVIRDLFSQSRISTQS